MTMAYCIQVGDLLEESKKIEINENIKKVFDEVNNLYNIWNQHSELSKLNSYEANVWVELSSKLYHLLLLTDQMVKDTNGLFDPTIAPLQALWKNHLINNMEPPMELVSNIRESIGWNNLVLRDGFILKKNRNTQIDLSGIAKGYCIDLLIDKLKDLGVQNCFVEWGGEIAVIGEHPQKRPWKVFISHLEDTNPDHAIDTLHLRNQAVATSGDYLQQWKLTDHNLQRTKIFTHLINPKKLTPLELTENSICSVTITADKCYKADAYATALMLYDHLEEAKEWIRSMQKKDSTIDVWIVQRR